MRAAITSVIFFTFILGIFCSPLVAQNNPAPFVNNPLVPAAALPNSTGFTLAVNGAGFVSGAVVEWNGSARVTHFVSSAQVTATILASDLLSPASVSVWVSNPSPGGGVSNIVTFEVTTPTTSLAFDRNDTDFDSSLEEPENIIAIDEVGAPLMAIENGMCPANRGCLIQKADITVVENGSFIADTPYTGADPGYFAAGDFNGDGIPDLITASGSGLAVSLGLGDGSFQLYQEQEIEVLETSSTPPTFALGDFNRDGHLDLALLISSGVYFLSGNGDGTFGTPVLVAGGTSTGSSTVSTGDFNGDGILDLVVSNLDTNSVSILLGKGDGTFQSPVDYPTGSSALTAIVADFNRDGKLDLGIVNYLETTVSIFLGKGDGTFQPKVDYPAGTTLASTLASISLGDYNGDGVMDLAVTDPQCPKNLGCTGSGTGSVNVLLGNGDGSFQSPLNFASGGQPFSIASGEFVSQSSQIGRSGFAVVNTNGTASVYTPIQTETGGNNPIPTIASFSPSSVVAGSGSFTLAVNGADFVAGSSISFGGVVEPTMFVSATQIAAVIPASAITSAGNVEIVVTTPAPGGGAATSSNSFQVLLPPPAVSSLSPLSVVVGSPGFTLVINGAKFVPSAEVKLNGVQRSAVFVSSTQMTVGILASDLMSQGSISVTVTTLNDVDLSVGGTSSPAILTILPANSQPTVGGLVPASTTAGGPSFTLSIAGTGFSPSSTVSFGSNSVSSAFVSSTELQASIPASAIAVGGTRFVTVANPGGTPSVVTTFTVNNPIPAPSGVSPLSVPAGSAAVNVSISGTNFNSSSKALVNGSVRVTTFVSTTSLTAALLTSDLAHSGALTISVSNPSPGGGTTGGVTLVIVDFNVTAVTPSTIVIAGQSANFNLMLAPANGTMTNAVTFAVTSGLPAGATPTFLPSASFPAGTSQTTVMLSIATTPHSAASSEIYQFTQWPQEYFLSWAALEIAVLAMGFLALGGRTRRLAPQFLLIALLFITAGLAACRGAGSGASPSSQLNPATGTPAGTYTVVVTTTSGGASVNTNITLTVM